MFSFRTSNCSFKVMSWIVFNDPTLNSVTKNTCKSSLNSPCRSTDTLLIHSD
ncbi:hypothetical protein DFO57_104450 [Pantoea sp. AG702]|nr:hypothetical protein DFO57_104450 [Pantoea sp. AG702]